MTITNDVFRLDLLKEGTSGMDAIRNSSRAYVENLEKEGFIYLDAFGNIYLTEKGKAAKRIGVEKFVEIERFEHEIQAGNSPRNLFIKRLFFLVFCTFNLVVAVLLIYVLTAGM